jgi:two-component system sensor histidine kinase AlgZ
VSDDSIVRKTLLALLEPRRSLPIVLMSIPLIFAQRSYSRAPEAGAVGLALCAAFVLVAPVSWRVLFPDGLEFRHGAIRVLLYAAIGAGVVLTVGLYIPRMLGIGDTFLTARSSLMIDVALFLVGGWGLGRDIGFEASLNREKKRASMLAREAEHAQLLALRSQLDPHFLFNTLNAIAEWCRTDGEIAERAVLELSSLLRAVLVGVTETSWPLAKELELVQTLFSLHLRRDPAMFTLRCSLPDDAARLRVPPMLLLPLAENAVKHGPAQGHRGEISLVVIRDGERVRVTLKNPGRYAGPREGSHGLPTLQRRLALAYDGKASMRVHADGEATVVEVELPAAGPEVAA